MTTTDDNRPAGNDPPASDGDAARGSDARPRRRWARSRLWWTPMVLAVLAGLLAAGAALGNLASRSPDEGSVDVGFARDMSEHHAQAVQMAMIEFSHGGDPDTRSVAQDIALTQQREIGIMSSWLSGWGRPQSTSGTPMRWMRDSRTVNGASGGHDGHAGPGAAMPGMDLPGLAGGAAQDASSDPRDTARMPGMATPAELQRLASIRGHDLDVLFLTLMVHHHQGGLAMAQYAAMHAGEDRVRAMARAMVLAQSMEIDQMQRDLVRLGAPRA